MDYINKSQLNDMLKTNELENIYYHMVQASYTYELTDLTSGKDVDHTTSQAMYKIKKDGEDLFIMMDVYKEYEPFYMILKREDLAKKEFSVMSTNLFSLEQEKERIDKILAKKVGGSFDPSWNNKFHVFSQDFELDNQIGLFASNLREEHLNRFEKQLVRRLTEVSELNTAVKNDSMGVFTDMVDKVVSNKIEQNNNFLSKLANTFDTNLENKLSEMNEIYNERLEQKTAERLAQLADERNKRFEQEKVQEVLNVQLARADILEQFGYYPVINLFKDDLNVSMFDKKGDVLDSFKLKATVHDVEIGYNRDEEPVYETLVSIDDKSIDSVGNKNKEKYFHAFYMLENAIGFQDKRQVDIVADKFDFSEKDFSFFISDENSLTKEMSKEFKNEKSLKYANEMFEDFKESIKKPKNKMKP